MSHPLSQPITGLMMRQKVTMMVNRYRITPIYQDGNEGPVIAFAEQKRMKLREEVVFFTDESKQRVACSFKSRNVIDMAATTDIFDHDRRPIGVFRKDAARSLLNSTWYLEGPGVQATGRERSQGVAIVRRFGGMLPFIGDLLDLIPWQFHFDFVTQGGETVLVSERQPRIRDEYRLSMPLFGQGQQIDWRIAAAMGVALDAFQGR